MCTTIIFISVIAIIITVIVLYLNKINNHQKSLNSIIKVINVTNSIPFKDKDGNVIGWEVDSGYPAPTMIIYHNSQAPKWIQNLNLYERLFISTKKPGFGPYEKAIVTYPNESVQQSLQPQPYGWTSIDNEQNLQKCCLDSQGKLDINKFNENYGNRIQIQNGWIYALVSADNKKRFGANFWLGAFKSSNSDTAIPPYPQNTEMYIFPSSLNK